MTNGSTMSQQIKELMRKYGKVAVGVHLGVYATTFAGKDPHRTGGVHTHWVNDVLHSHCLHSRPHVQCRVTGA